MNKNIRDLFYGLDTPVKLKDGSEVPAICLDNAATTPPLKQVVEEVNKQLLSYSSIGRGKGQKSDHSTQVYTNGRDVVLDFAGAVKEGQECKYSVIYTNCTTDGMNKLASALIKNHREIVLTTRMEHHADDLPWRERCRMVYADVDENGRLKLEDFKKLLEKYNGEENTNAHEKIKYVSVTAASNVTGYVNDVHAIAAIAHKYGAKIIVDGAQIVAHREFSVLGTAADGSEDIDFFVFSAHKMYSPYGGGAIVGLTDMLNDCLPVFYGGGMVDAVADTDVDYAQVPDRYEAGSPNYPGVVGMVTAMQVLKGIGFDTVRGHEQTLLERTFKGLAAIPNVILYGDCEHYDDRVGIVVFNIVRLQNEFVADILAGYKGIAVRHAKFCSHTYVSRLLGQTDAARGCSNNGMVRVSFGLYNDEKDVDALIEIVRDIAEGKYPVPTMDMAAAPARITKPNDRG